MSNNKFSLSVEPELQEVLDRLPRGTKNRFVNLCIRQVVFDKTLMNSVYSKLMGIPVNINNLEENPPFEIEVRSTPVQQIPPQAQPANSQEESVPKTVTSKDIVFSVK